MFDIQPAKPDYAEAIRVVKDAVWPDDATSVKHIQAILKQPDQQAHIAQVDGVPAGLVSGFLTLSSTGVCRWEVDLLAVRSDFRRRGIATALIRACVEAGVDMGAREFRALIHVDNIGSQTAFANCGFQAESDIYALYVSSDASDETGQPPERLHLIPVNTLNYRGVWLEGQVDAASLRLAQAIRTRYQWDVAGAVIALRESDLLNTAEAAGYFRVGDYQRWYWRL